MYNSISTLPKCIESILSQSYKEWEMIIVDDCSNDGSEFFIKNIKDNRVNKLRNLTNRGLAYSLNKAISLCNTPFIARADSDDVQHPDRLLNQLIFLEKNPQVDLLSTSAYLLNSKRTKKIDIPTSHKEISQKLKKNNCILHPTVMMRTSFFRKFGLYDETFRRAQDYELWLRALKKGAIFGALNEPLIYYNTKNYDWPFKTLFLHSFNRTRIFLRHQTLSQFFFFIKDLLHPYFLKLIAILKTLNPNKIY